ncbi:MULTISPECIES: hypothetical protein [unclassified Mesorhizobium]|nr:hypothetical protein [Mesorhizobium sp. LSJC268A00]
MQDAPPSRAFTFIGEDSLRVRRELPHPTREPRFVTTDTLLSILTILMLWSGLTMAFDMIAPEHLQPAKMDRIASLAENVFVGAVFALLALLAAL